MCALTGKDRAHEGEEGTGQGGGVFLPVVRKGSLGRRGSAYVCFLAFACVVAGSAYYVLTTHSLAASA
jgi:hypothetical protein